MDAAWSGHADVVASLVVFGGDINVITDDDTQTPLMYAISQNRLECVRLLIDLNAEQTTTKTVWSVSQKIQKLLSNHSKKSVRFSSCVFFKYKIQMFDIAFLH